MLNNLFYWPNVAALKSLVPVFLLLTVLEAINFNLSLSIPTSTWLVLKGIVILRFIRDARITSWSKNYNSLLVFALPWLGVSLINQSMSDALTFLLFNMVVFILMSSNLSQSGYILICKLFVIFNCLSLFIPGISFHRVEGRFNGLLVNPNELGITLAIVFVIFWTYRYLLYRDKIWLTSVFVLLILSGNRSGLLAVLVFILVYIPKARVYSALFIIPLVIGFDYNWVLEKVRFTSMGSDSLLSGREVAWKFAYDTFKDSSLMRQLFGWGYGKTETLFMINSEMLSLEGHQGNAHNSYLTLLLDYGLIGLLLFFNFLRPYLSRYKSLAIVLILIGFTESFLSPSFGVAFTLSLGVLMSKK